MNLDLWREDVITCNTAGNELANKLHTGLKGTRFAVNVGHRQGAGFLDEVMTYASIDFTMFRKGTPIRASMKRNAELIDEGIISKADVRQWCTGYDQNGKGFSVFDKLKEVSVETKMDFIRVLALRMEMYCSQINTKWIWEILEALNLNRHVSDQDMWTTRQGIVSTRLSQLCVNSFSEYPPIIEIH